MPAENRLQLVTPTLTAMEVEYILSLLPEDLPILRLKLHAALIEGQTDATL